MSDVIALNEQLKALTQRVEDLQLTHQLIVSLDKNFAVQTQVLESIKKENERQNAQLTDYAAMLSKQHETLSTVINGQQTLQLKLETQEVKLAILEEELQSMKNKTSIDLHEVNKNTALGDLASATKKTVIPAGLGVLLYELLQALARNISGGS